MPTDPKLEQYLTAIERALRPLPASERAEIITELKSHVLSALERDPNEPMDNVLAALGSPETVANRYLLERGSKPVKPPLSPIIKWLVFGFVSTLALVLLFAGVVVWRMAPFLGQIAHHGNVHFNWPDSKHEFVGWSDIAESDTRPLQINFQNGAFDISTSEGRKLGWSCHSSQKETGTNKLVDNGAAWQLDLRNLSELDCEIEIPRHMALQMRGENGKVDFDEPRFAVDLQLQNGKIDFAPDQNEKYHYALTAGNGFVDRFDSSDAPDALMIKMQLGNGLIRKEDE